MVDTSTTKAERITHLAALLRDGDDLYDYLRQHPGAFGEHTVRNLVNALRACAQRPPDAWIVATAPYALHDKRTATLFPPGAIDGGDAIPVHIGTVADWI